MKNRRDFLKTAAASTTIPLLLQSLPLGARADVVTPARGIDLGIKGIPPLVEPGCFVILGEQKTGRTRLLRHMAANCNARRALFIEEHEYFKVVAQDESVLPAGRDHITFYDAPEPAFYHFPYLDRVAKARDTFIVLAPPTLMIYGTRLYPDCPHMELDREGHLSVDYPQVDPVTGASGRLVDVRHIVWKEPFERGH